MLPALGFTDYNAIFCHSDGDRDYYEAFPWPRASTQAIIAGEVIFTFMTFRCLKRNEITAKDAKGEVQGKKVKSARDIIADKVIYPINGSLKDWRTNPLGDSLMTSKAFTGLAGFSIVLNQLDMAGRAHYNRFDRNKSKEGQYNGRNARAYRLPVYR